MDAATAKQLAFDMTSHQMANNKSRRVGDGLEEPPLCYAAIM